MWSKVEANELHTPLYKKGPIRLKKQRFRKMGESGLRIKGLGVSHRCAKCDKLGQNSRR